MKRNFKVDNKENNGSIKVRISNPFSWLPNSLVSDENVSAEALAVALYLNGKPDNWHARPFDIRKRFGWGDKKWRSVSKELVSLGLLKYTKHQKGTTVTFHVDFAPVPFGTVPKRHSAQNGALNKKEKETKKETTKKKELKPIGHTASDRQSGYTEGFERFWSNYPKRVAKADAFKAFKAKGKERSVKHEEFADFLIKHIEQRCKTEWKGKERKYIPNAASFLRQERWEDDLSYTNDIATDKPAAYTNRFRTHLYDSQPAKVPGLDNMELNVYEHE